MRKRFQYPKFHGRGPSSVISQLNTSKDRDFQGKYFHSSTQHNIILRQNSRIQCYSACLFKKLFSSRFELKQAQNIAGIPSDVIRGCKFTIDKIDPLVFEVDGGPEETTGCLKIL